MHIELTTESLLSQLGYSVNDSSLKQMENIINNTENFDKFSKHLLGLNDNLKHTNSYIAMSNSHNYFKIKSETTNDILLKEFEELINKWATKYNVTLEKVENKNVYYIIGIKG
jgi:hypothetical protein